MGERSKSQGTLFQPQFNRAITVESTDRLLTEDSGAVLLREVAEGLDLPGALAGLRDSRDASRITHPLVELLLTRVLLYAQGERQQDDADRLRFDGALRAAVSERGGDRALRPPRHAREATGLASQPTLSRMNTMLSSDENLAVLAGALLQTSVHRIESLGRRDELVIDVDSFARETHGAQEGSVYNGHYHMTCLHPLIAFSDTGDILGVVLRAGNVHTADQTRPFLEPIIEATRHLAPTLWVRFDAGYAAGDFFDWLEERDVRWVTRLRSTQTLNEKVEAWRDRVEAKWAREGRADEPRTELFEFQHQAGSWSRERRVIAILLERSDGNGELFNDLFFLATSDLVETGAKILERYRRRGIAEQHIGEFKRALCPTVASHDLGTNQVTSLVAALAYELMHHLRDAIAKLSGEARMTMQTLRERVLKVATLIVRHGRRLVFRICSSKAMRWREASLALARAPRCAVEATTAC